VVFVTGEAGIGKTALVEAFLAGLGQRGIGNGEQARQKAKIKRQKPVLSGVEGAKVPDPRLLFPDPWLSWGQCIEHYGAGEPYLPVLEALGRLCREQDGRQLIDLLAQHAPTWVVQLPALLTATELEGLHRKTAGATKERMLRELGEALEVLTAERPLILWLEDLHWCDPSTLDWLAFVARRRERARLLIIGSYRPVETIVREHPLRTVKQELQVHGQCGELALGALSEAAVGEYVAVRCGWQPSRDRQRAARRIETERETERRQDWPLADGHGSDRLPVLARTIHRRTDGKPLFMVNVVEQLLAPGATKTAGEGDQGAALLAAIGNSIPENLRQLIEQQFERLKPEERQVLEVASVERLDFSAAAVAAGFRAEVEVVDERCAELARRGQFLRADGIAEWPDGTVAGRYRFLHALYQEVIQEWLSEGRREALHRRIGERRSKGMGSESKKLPSNWPSILSRGEITNG
jgi:predicted ATPase